jgi:hypothetical protein
MPADPLSSPFFPEVSYDGTDDQTPTSILLSTQRQAS